MTWIVAGALAVLAFIVAAFLFRVPRSGWTMILAALVFGLAGYAFQATPGYPGAPKSAAAEDIGDAGWQMVELRKSLVDEDHRSQSREIITADAMVRQGQFENAVALLDNAVKNNPRDSEAWLAMANALVEHADGNLTPAALHAYRRAAVTAPDEPGPAVFMGFSMVRQGRLIEAHRLWSETLSAAPDDAEWRPFLAQRIALLEQLMRQIVESSQAEGQ